MRTQERSPKKSVKQKKVTDNVSPQGTTPKSYVPDEKDRLIQFLKEYNERLDKKLDKTWRQIGELTYLLKNPLFVEFEIIPKNVRYTALKDQLNSISFKN